jgi:hypothetical protein
MNVLENYYIHEATYVTVSYGSRQQTDLTHFSKWP